MDIKLLEKLHGNPHYKMSVEQLQEYNLKCRKPMISFGTPEVEKNIFVKHETNVVKSNYETKKTSRLIQDKPKRSKR